MTESTLPEITIGLVSVSDRASSGVYLLTGHRDPGVYLVVVED